jgi:hypothetical protein
MATKKASAISGLARIQAKLNFIATVIPVAPIINAQAPM